MDISSDISSASFAQVASLSQSLGAKAKDPKAIDAASKEFETVFLAQMLEHMFEGVSVDPLSAGSEGEDVYKSWMIQQYGKTLTDAGGIGIADYVKRELLHLQEVQSGSAQAAPLLNSKMQGTL